VAFLFAIKYFTPILIPDSLRLIARPKYTLTIGIIVRMFNVILSLLRWKIARKLGLKCGSSTKKKKYNMARKKYISKVQKYNIIHIYNIYMCWHIHIIILIIKIVGLNLILKYSIEMDII